jgi:hypothetical protein
VLANVVELKARINFGLSEAMTEREIIQAAYDRATEAPRLRAEAKKKADEAKKLASLNVKSSMGASPKSSFKSLEDEMAATYDRIQAAG